MTVGFTFYSQEYNRIMFLELKNGTILDRTKNLDPETLKYEDLELGFSPTDDNVESVSYLRDKYLVICYKTKGIYIKKRESENKFISLRYLANADPKLGFGYSELKFLVLFDKFIV